MWTPFKPLNSPPFSRLLRESFADERRLRAQSALFYSYNRHNRHNSSSFARDKPMFHVLSRSKINRENQKGVFSERTSDQATSADSGQAVIDARGFSLVAFCCGGAEIKLRNGGS